MYFTNQIFAQKCDPCLELAVFIGVDSLFKPKIHFYFEGPAPSENRGGGGAFHNFIGGGRKDFRY